MRSILEVIRRVRFRCMVGGCILLLAACGGGVDDSRPRPQIDPYGGKEPPSLVRALPGVPISNQAPMGIPTSAGESPQGLTPEEDIVFTDPDDPEASLPQLSSILTDPSGRRGPWEQSIQIAKRRAVREGKPLLIWFTDSRTSPMCKALQEELFQKPDFEKWADENLIRLRIDEHENIDDPDLSLGERETLRVNLRVYVKRLKNQYRVLGYPSLVLLSPSGKVEGRYRGYKRGGADFTWGLIKQGSVVAGYSYRAWRKSLEQKGYRQWHDLKGRSVFAKLTRYHRGALTLIEPDGTRSKTLEKDLSLADRQWIEQQKRERRMR